jgi:hypothetical protein
VSFLDGIDTRGAPSLGTATNDRFTGIALASDMHLVNYNFGERGVANPTKALELASTPSPQTIMYAMVMQDEPMTLETQVRQSISPPVNTVKAVDVDADGYITATDVLLVINYINAHNAISTPRVNTAATSPISSHCDVDADGVVTASDVLAIINYINAHPSQGEANSSNDRSDLPSMSADDDLDLLVDTLAADVAVAIQKKH